MVAIACSSTTRGIDDPAGSGGSGDAGSAKCADFVGGYVITDQCTGEKQACAVAQEGCAAQLSCTGMASRPMELSGNDVSFTGVDGPCTGSLSGDLIDGSCSDGCGFQGLRLSRDPRAPDVSPPTCGFNVSDVVPTADDSCDSCAESACCTEMTTCKPPSPCSNLLGCIKLNCALDNAAACASAECPALTTTGGPDLNALVSCLSASCPGCGF
jgi:hypothetical protein